MSTPSHHQRSQAEQSTLFEVGGDPPPEAKPFAPMRGRPRLRTANRDQIVFRAASLDDLIPDDHPARLVWDYVDGLDLSPVYDRIQAVERGPGRAPIDPKILMALWLYATTDGVGSARQLDELCRTHVAYQWIVGDVSINYHTLADFRTDHVALLDDLLTHSVATLMAEGLVDLNRVAQDGMRVRASAGAASFRRRPTLEEALRRPGNKSRRCVRRPKRTRPPPTGGGRRRNSGRRTSGPSGSRRRWIGCPSWRRRRSQIRRSRRGARRPMPLPR